MLAAWLKWHIGVDLLVEGLKWHIGVDLCQQQD
jgi:hypothetical protein